MTIRVNVENLGGYHQSRLIEEIETTLKLLGIETGTIEIADDPENVKHDENQIQYDPNPDQCVATVFFTDDADWEEWDGNIEETGRVRCLTDTTYKQYHTMAELKAAGVKRITLETQHVIWVADE